jgi:polynucleotide 5'-kinase involved in rRNA processing
MREERFRLYFKNSTIQHIDCAPPPSWEYRIVGLYDHEKFLGLGVAKNKEATKLGVITPVWAKATGIEFGYIKLDPERGEAYISR